MIGIRYPIDVQLVGDAKETLAALDAACSSARRTARWREQIEAKVERLVAAWSSAARTMDARPDEPAARGLGALAARCPTDAILTRRLGLVDELVRARPEAAHGQSLASLSGTLATMGPGVPYAIAAKFALPRAARSSRFVGDGAFQMNGMNELITVASATGAAGSDRGSSFCVLNNQDLNQVTWEQRVMEGDPKFPGTQWMPDFPTTPPTPSCSACKGICCDDGDQVGAAWDEALAADRPVVLEVKVDPEIPPLPPHITSSRPRRWRRRWSRATRSASA